MIHVTDPDSFLINQYGVIKTYNPVWSGTGLTYNNTPATGSYIRVGNLIQVQIDVIYTGVTNFGNGQYSLTLPFPSKYHTDVYGGSAHDTLPNLKHYSLKGHLTPSSSIMTIWQHAGNAEDVAMDHGIPFNATTSDKFHMSFSYICE
jgi:hypothetical protein